MSKMSDYVCWMVDKFKDTPEAYDVLTKYVTEHREEIGPEYSEAVYLADEVARSFERGIVEGLNET